MSPIFHPVPNISIVMWFCPSNKATYVGYVGATCDFHVGTSPGNNATHVGYDVATCNCHVGTCTSNKATMLVMLLLFVIVM